MAYSSKVTDTFQKTIDEAKNVGSLDKKADDVGTGLVGAPACGDVMQLQIKVGDDGKIADAKFLTYGCGSAIASSSLATEWLKGKTVDEAETIKNSMIAEELNLPPVKIHCSVLAEDAIKSAIANYREKQLAKKSLQNGVLPCTPPCPRNRCNRTPLSPPSSRLLQKPPRPRSS